MLTLLRSAGAWLAGVVAGGLTVFVLELLSHQIWPPPADLDFSDTQALAELMARAPVGALIALILGWTLGGAVGSLVASLIASWRRVLIAGMAGGMTLVGAALNLMAIPHPVWVTILGPAGVLFGMLAGTWLGMQLKASEPAGLASRN